MTTSIEDEIQDLETSLAAAKAAVTAKGGSAGNTGLSGLASEIAAIPSGGGSTPTFARVELYPYIKPDSIMIWLQRDANGHYTVATRAGYEATPSGVQIDLYDAEIDAGAAYWGITASNIKYIRIGSQVSSGNSISIYVNYFDAGNNVIGSDEGDWSVQRQYWGFQIQGADTTGPVSTMDFNWTPASAQGWRTPSTAADFMQWGIPEYAIKQVTYTQSS